MTETARSPSLWLESYPQEYRDIIGRFGVDDKGDPLLVKFNEALMDRCDYCQGKDRFIFKVLLGYLYEDWDDVLEGRSREIPEHWKEYWSNAQNDRP